MKPGLFYVISRHNRHNQRVLFEANWEHSRGFPEYEVSGESGAGLRFCIPVIPIRILQL